MVGAKLIDAKSRKKIEEVSYRRTDFLIFYYDL